MSADIFRKYALWLMPKGEPYEKFSALINELSFSYSTPPFEPHITLIGGLTPPEEDIIEKSEELALALKPFAAEPVGIGHLDEYYRCLFVKMKEAEGIMGANETARKLFGRMDDPPFMPHLSLMYGNLKVSRKNIIITSLGKDILNVRLEFNSLHLYCTEGEPSEWYGVREFLFG